MAMELTMELHGDVSDLAEATGLDAPALAEALERADATPDSIFAAVARDMHGYVEDRMLGGDYDMAVSALAALDAAGVDVAALRGVQ